LALYPDEEYLYTFLASFGESVTVVRPPQVKQELLRRKSLNDIA